MKCYGWEAPSLQFAMESGTYKDAGFKDIYVIINIFCIQKQVYIYIFRCVHVQRFSDAGADEILL